MAGTIEVRTQKHSDAAFIEKWIDLAKSIGAQSNHFRIGNEAIANNVPLTDTETSEEYVKLKPFIEIDSSVIEAALNFSHHSVKHVRGSPFDQITIAIPNQQQFESSKSAQLLKAVRDHFPNVDLNESLMEIVNEDTRRYYEQREAALLRLEQLSEKLIKDNEAYRQKLDLEKSNFEHEVEDEFKQKEGALEERSAELDAREQEMELADAKSARRKLRNDLLAKLGAAVGVRLTPAQQAPIHVVFVAAISVLAYLAVSILGNPNFDLLELSHALKLGLTSAGIVGTLMLYYRWMDSWVRKSVDEELRFRQLAIDVDRSTWIIEVLSELKDETGTSIPDEVLTALTRNLFTGSSSTQPVTHPAEDVIAALLSSSREVEVEFPGGKVKTDGRGVRKATKGVSE